MNDTDTALLRAELTQDPAGLGYAPLVAAGDDVAVADALNAVRQGIQVPCLVERHRVKTLLYGTGEMLGIKSGTSGEARLAAMYLDDPDYQNVDLGLPVVQGLLSALLSGGVLSQGTVDTIQVMGQRPGSRAEQLGLEPVTHLDVARALRG